MTTGAIKYGDVVRSAEGTMYSVRYLHHPPGGAEREAELAPLDEHGDLSMDLEAKIMLPVRELRRVPDPRKARPPIEGLPAKRPRCAWCDRPLRIVCDNIFDKANRPGGRRLSGRVFRFFVSYEEVFCTTRCAIAFAGASYRGGYRRVIHKGEK
jgi:hypothetical protein